VPTWDDPPGSPVNSHAANGTPAGQAADASANGRGVAAPAAAIRTGAGPTDAGPTGHGGVPDSSNDHGLGDHGPGDHGRPARGKGRANGSGRPSLSETGQAAAILRAAGWRVACVDASTPLQAAWQQLAVPAAAKPPVPEAGTRPGAAV
jgi:hypothetical protein